MLFQTDIKTAVAFLVSAVLRRSLILVFAVLAALVMVGFLVAAGWTMLADLYGSAGASLIIAGVMAVCLIVLLGVDALYRRRVRRRAAQMMAQKPGAGLAPVAVQVFAAAMDIGKSLRK